MTRRIIGRGIARGVSIALPVLTGLAFAGCGPHTPYVRPTTPVAPAYKENADWKPAQPRDEAPRGQWWEIFDDPQLNTLEEQVNVSNETLKATAAQFAQAQALLRGARAMFYPQVGVAPKVTGQQLSGTVATSTFHTPYNDFLLPVSASYEGDVWGRIRSVVAASRASAQATAADLETVRLSVHADLAVDYFTLRGFDRQSALLTEAVAAYTRALELTVNRFQGGIASQADVAFAETQLETTRAQLIDVDSTRATLEHAIAVLVGQPASYFTLARLPLTADPPGIPVGVPSELLERRPDIASAERSVAAATAQVNVASSAFYPLLTLSASAGYESGSLGNLLANASNFWAIGPTVAVSVFDGGRRRATVDQTRAAVDQAAANYRETVLSAFQEVEDQLATLRVLDNEATVQARAVAASQRSLTLANNRYTGGVTTYLEVLTAQNAALTNEETAVNVLTRRMTASVLLLKALGGGWNESQLPQFASSKP
jgi:NodT family efflux transporter outer membrane factor (OMF) lipoprotein